MTTRAVGALLMLAVLCGGGVAQLGDLPPASYTAPIRGEKWTLRFESKGKFVLLRKDKLAVEGVCKVTKNRIEFTDVKGPGAHTGAPPGVFEWKLEGKQLRFVTITDESKARAKALTAQPWAREE